MVEASNLSQAIANGWERWAPMLGEERERIECRLTILLRQLDQAAGSDQAAAITAILDLFRQFDVVYAQLIEAIRDGATKQHKGAAMHYDFDKKDRHMVVPVFFGTSRAMSGGGSAATSYGGERGDLTYGIANVSIPDDHRMGEIERPWGVWKLRFSENPDAHVVVLGIEQLPLDAFAAQAAGMLQRSSKKDVLLFVHGYNFDFTEALTRAAQIAYDLHFQGLPALFSWPSRGSSLMYMVDETNVAWSRPQFEQFLGVLRERLGAETIHIIAHSMGSRLVAETMASMALAQTASGTRLRQIVFAAPDIDAATFKNFAKSFHQKAERFTLYASSGDLALAASRYIHGHPRAGDSGLDLVIVDPVDTIDASEVDTSLKGHSYFGDMRSVLTDLFQLIRKGDPPQERHLKERKKFGERYWIFGP